MSFSLSWGSYFPRRIRMRRFWYNLTQVYWIAVISAVLALAGVVLAVLGYDMIALAVGLASISTAVLATRN